MTHEEIEKRTDELAGPRLIQWLFFTPTGVRLLGGLEAQEDPRELVAKTLPCKSPGRFSSPYSGLNGPSIMPLDIPSGHSHTPNIELFGISAAVEVQPR
jgi:hypothetical protein